MVEPVLLQINMAPSDLRYVRHILPHQLRVLAGQVSHIQFTIDSHHSRAGRFSTENHADRLIELRRFLEATCETIANSEIVDVDYRPDVVREVGLAFFGREEVPKKAYGGSPIYPYLYALFRSRQDYVFHSDSDMLYGGASQNWVKEAVTLLGSNPTVLACNPLAGPPRPDGVLTTQHAVSANPRSFTYRFEKFSTRVFLLDRRRIMHGLHTIPLVRANSRQTLQAVLNNTSPYLNLEDCVTDLMKRDNLQRVDFLGESPGLWTLHPPFRSETFFSSLPEIIRRVEADDVPDAQRGDFDLNDSMIDWSDARRRSTIGHRSLRQLRLASVNAAERLRTTFLDARQ